METGCCVSLQSSGSAQSDLAGAGDLVWVGRLCLDTVNGAERTHTGRSWGGSGTSIGGSISLPFCCLMWTKAVTEWRGSQQPEGERLWRRLSTGGGNLPQH